MTLFVFPNPRPAVKAVLNEAKAAHWPTATITTAFPTSAISAPVIQHAYDGSPTQEQQRQECSIRVTFWTPKGQVDAAIDGAHLVAAAMLEAGSESVWRFRTPTGFLNGIDPDSGLPFCTFNITAETRPAAVA